MDDKRITPLEADGLAPAAIQGLHQKLEQKEAKIRGLEHTLRQLDKRVEVLSQQLDRNH